MLTSCGWTAVFAEDDEDEENENLPEKPVSDPEAGDYTFPGSVFDTPELIASLTTDMSGEYHGTHTAAIAAGTLSPQGFGGMAPDADLVLIPAGYFDEDLYDDEEDVIEEAIAFAVAYANQSDQPTVLSASLNSHAGAHIQSHCDSGAHAGAGCPAGNQFHAPHRLR